MPWIEWLDHALDGPALPGCIDAFDDDQQAGSDPVVVRLTAEVEAEFEELLLCCCQTGFVVAVGEARREVDVVESSHVDPTIGRRSIKGTNPHPTASGRYGEASMFVKICGITNEDDALLSVAMGADAVGFVFAPSPRQIAAQVAYDITRRLPPEILTVGVFRNELPARVVELAHKSGVKAVQLHGRETAAQCIEVAKQIKWVIKAFGSDDENLPAPISSVRI